MSSDLVKFADELGCAICAGLGGVLEGAVSPNAADAIAVLGDAVGGAVSGGAGT